MRVWVGALLLTGCLDEGDRFAPIVVDIAANCAEVEIDVLLAEMEDGARPWTRVLAVAVDAPGVDNYWTLIELEDELDPDVTRLGMLHIEGSEIGPLYVFPTDPRIDDTTLELRPGPVPGSAWLVQKGPGIFGLWQFSADQGDYPLVGASPELGTYPRDEAFNCPGEFGPEPCDVTDWTRELVFLDGFAFVAGVPDFSLNNTTYVYLGRLDPYLFIDGTTPLEFDRQCDPTDPLPEYTECTEENAATTYPSITVMGSQMSTSAAEHRMFLLRERAIDDVPQPTREIVFLKLLLDDHNNAAGTIQSKALQEFAPVLGSPSGIARDDFASYMLHPARGTGTEEFPVITRLSELEDEFDTLQGIALPQDIALLQLESDIALGHVVDGTWEVTKLFPDAPERSGISVYQGSSTITSFAPAGHGAFLLFKEEGGPDLVQLRCPEDGDPTSGSSSSG
jgi:hypothetical protein